MSRIHMQHSSATGHVYSAHRSSEICEAAGTVCELPSELFELSDLSDVLCLEVWNDVLSDDDRETLGQYLPAVQDEELLEVLQDTLGGYNVYFGNPKDTLFDMLKSGMCSKQVATRKRAYQVLQRKKHYYELRSYHNRMVNALLDMKKMWQWMPDLSLGKKLEHWKYRVENLGSDKVAGKEHSTVKKEIVAILPRKKKVMDESDEDDNEDVPLAKISHKNRLGKAKKTTKIESPTSKKRLVEKVDVKAGDEEDPHGLPPLNPMDSILGFSIVHLLSSVRSAFQASRSGRTDGQDWLIEPEIVERVRQHPLDPRVLLSRFSLESLIHNSLLVLQTKAPPGTRLWKPFVQQKKHLLKQIGQREEEWTWCGDIDAAVVGGGDETEWGISEKAFAKLRERLVVNVTSTNLKGGIGVDKGRGSGDMSSQRVSEATGVEDEEGGRRVGNTKMKSIHLLPMTETIQKAEPVTPNSNFSDREDREFSENRSQSNGADYEEDDYEDYPIEGLSPYQR